MSSNYDISPTRWGLLLQCPAKAYAKYVAKNLPKEESVPLRVGDLVHKALARAGRVFKDTHGKGGLTEQDLRNGIDLEGEVNPEPVKLAYELVAACWNKIDLSRAIDFEVEFKAPMGEVDGVKSGNMANLWGFMDRIDRHPDGSVMVLDYKTGYDVKDDEELACDPQAIAYLIGARSMFPDAPRIGFTLHYLARNMKVGPVWWNPSLDTWGRNAARSALLRFLYHKVSKWPEKINAFCGSCALRFDCKAYKADTSLDKPQTLAAKLKRIQVLRHKKKACETECSAIQREVKAIFRTSDTVFAPGFTGKLITASNQTSYDAPEALVAKATNLADDPDLLWKICKIDHGAVQEYLLGVSDHDTRKQLQDAFEEASRSNQYSWIKVNEAQAAFAIEEVAP